jgi:hypothetical protein
MKTKIKYALLSTLALFIASIGIAGAETQDAGVQITAFEDINGMRLKFSIEGITDVRGPWTIDFYNYDENGTRTKIATKDYDGASWNDITAGTKHFDWIELDPVKLHAGYNIVTAKIIFGPLNSITEINPKNNMSSFVIYYEPLPDIPAPVHVYGNTAPACSANCHEDRLPYTANHNPRGITAGESSICMECHLNNPPPVIQPTPTPIVQNPYNMVKVGWLSGNTIGDWYEISLENGGRLFVKDTLVKYTIKNIGDLPAHGNITVYIKTRYHTVSKTVMIGNINPGEKIQDSQIIPSSRGMNGISHSESYEMFS